MKHMIMAVTKKPDQPATVNDDIFTGTEQECQQHLIDMVACLIDERNWKHEIFEISSTSVYAAPDDWVKLLVVPTTDIEIK